MGIPVLQQLPLMVEENGEVNFVTHDPYGENRFLVMTTNLHTGRFEGHAPPMTKSVCGELTHFLCISSGSSCMFGTG